jgi:hypothetical protein
MEMLPRKICFARRFEIYWIIFGNEDKHTLKKVLLQHFTETLNTVEEFTSIIKTVPLAH